MKKDMQNQTTHALTIREEVLEVADCKVTYRLCAIGNEEGSAFTVVLSTDQERSEMRAGYDLLHALDYYRQIVCGSVTPCTLDDIAEDFQYMEKI